MATEQSIQDNIFFQITSDTKLTSKDRLELGIEAFKDPEAMKEFHIFKAYLLAQQQAIHVNLIRQMDPETVAKAGDLLTQLFDGLKTFQASAKPLSDAVEEAFDATTNGKQLKKQISFEERADIVKAIFNVASTALPRLTEVQNELHEHVKQIDQLIEANQRIANIYDLMALAAATARLPATDAASKHISAQQHELAGRKEDIATVKNATMDVALELIEQGNVFVKTISDSTVALLDGASAINAKATEKTKPAKKAKKKAGHSGPGSH